MVIYMAPPFFWELQCSLESTAWQLSSERNEDLDFGPALEEDGFVKEGEDPHGDPVADDGGDLAIYKYVYINININTN